MLKGHWFGPYAGTHSGNIIAEFDEIGGNLAGTVTAYPGDPVPPAFTAVTIPTGRETFEAVVPLQPIDFRTGNPVPWAMIAGQHPGLNMSRVADTKWSSHGAATSPADHFERRRYVAENEEARGKKYLEAIDLPASERAQVMTELRMMGITAGSLFPGLDGVCEQLREQNFDL
jgi:hypothetical protein